MHDGRLAQVLKVEDQRSLCRGYLVQYPLEAEIILPGLGLPDQKMMTKEILANAVESPPVGNQLLTDLLPKGSG